MIKKQSNALSFTVEQLCWVCNFDLLVLITYRTLRLDINFKEEAYCNGKFKKISEKKMFHCFFATQAHRSYVTSATFLQNLK